MKLGGSTILMGGAWLVLSGCSGKYEVGLEPSAGTAGTGVMPSSSSGGATSSVGGSSGSTGYPPSAGSGGSMIPDPYPSPGPDSTCGFAPIVPAGLVVPSVGADVIAARVYALLESSDAPEIDPLPNPGAGFAATLATAILDAHFKAGTSVPGLEWVLQGMLTLDDRSPPMEAAGVWAAKLADPNATLSTLFAEPTGEPHRLGILTDHAVLTLHPSISPRGLWLTEKVFCMQVPPSPVNVPALPPSKPGVSKREALTQFVANPACAACHKLMDPPAYSLEHFDDEGNYRELDNGVPVDSGGTISVFVSSQSPAMSFDNFEDLAPQLAKSCVVTQCFTSQVLGALPQIKFSTAEANQIANTFADSGFSVRALVQAIVTSGAFLR